MIYGKFEYLKRYKGITPLIDKAIDYILANDLSQLNSQRIHLDGDKLFANYSSYTTTDDESLTFEAHRLYIDLQLILEGEERIDVAQLDKLTTIGEIPEKDYYEYSGTAEVSFPMCQGHFLLLYPEEAHRVKMALHTPCELRKIVFKICYS